MPAPHRADFRFLDRLRVRWAEVDLQQIVFNGHYLMYVDTAVSGYWRALAAPYHATMEALGGDLYVRKATLEYQGSARYDDQLEIGLRCAHLGNSSFRMAAGIFRHGQCLVHGEVVYIFADPRTQSSLPVPEALRQWLLAFEAGEPMVELTVTPAGASGWEAAVTGLRQPVFGEELGAPEAAALDAADGQALHAVARNRLGLAVACGRLVADGEGGERIGRIGHIGRIGRLATHAGVRGAGFGGRVLSALVAAGRDAGCRRLVLTAAPEAEGFYRRAGFQPAGEPVLEAGRPHQPMALELR